MQGPKSAPLALSFDDSERTEQAKGDSQVNAAHLLSLWVLRSSLRQSNAD